LAEPIEHRLKVSQQVKSDLQSYQQWIDELVATSVLKPEEADTLLSAQAATRKVIMVDDFTTEELRNKVNS
jgi:uncharacterized protein YutE (UPF0331/DUF86 family)